MSTVSIDLYKASTNVNKGVATAGFLSVLEVLAFLVNFVQGQVTVWIPGAIWAVLYAIACQKMKKRSVGWAWIACILTMYLGFRAFYELGTNQPLIAALGKFLWIPGVVTGYAMVWSVRGVMGCNAYRKWEREWSKEHTPTTGGSHATQ